MRQARFVNWVVVATLASFLGASSASADFGIAGEWYENRGATVNIPIGGGDITCPTLPSATIPVSQAGTDPIATPITNPVAAPCVRHQDPLGGTLMSGKALAVRPVFGIPAIGQVALSTVATPTAPGATFRVPPYAFNFQGYSQVAVPNNPTVQQLDTTFLFKGPAPIRVPTPGSAGGQNPGIATQTRLMQQNAWSGAGQPTRLNQNFNQYFDDGVDITRRVTYTAGSAGFGGTMGMLLRGVGAVYVVRDLLGGTTNELLVSPLGNDVNPYITVHMGRGYNSTQMRFGNSGMIYSNYNIPNTCTGSLPPSPEGCGLITGITGTLFTLAGATTTNIGFPWTTGHVSAYAKGPSGTTTLTAEGSDTVVGGVRTIQLVSGGVARRVATFATTKSPHVDQVTIRVPEPGSTMALVGALGLIGGLYGVRRRLF